MWFSEQFLLRLTHDQPCKNITFKVGANFLSFCENQKASMCFPWFQNNEAHIGPWKSKDCEDSGPLSKDSLLLNNSQVGEMRNTCWLAYTCCFNACL